MENAVKGRKAHLVIIAEDASENTGKKFADMCSYRQITCLRYGTKEQLGSAIGCGPRAVVSIRDTGLASSLIQMIRDQKDPSDKEE